MSLDKGKGKLNLYHATEELELCWGGVKNSIVDRGQREQGSGGGSPYSAVLEAAVILYRRFNFI